MSEKIVIMSPTVLRATYEWKAFLSRWSTIIKKANRTKRSIELLSGHKIYFKGETEGKRVLLGLHADIISIDEFAPFCGGEGILTHECKKGLDGSVISCRTCGAKGPWYPIDTDYSCNERAVNAWNQRA